MLRIKLQPASIIDLPVLIDFIDIYLRLDWHLPPKQLRELLQRKSSQVWVITADSTVIGFAIIYAGATLHNLFIAPAYRFMGIGAHVLATLTPTRVRVKRNMSSGDPLAFYERSGFVVDAEATGKPHIVVMESLQK